MLVHFRQRIAMELVNKINKKWWEKQKKKQYKKKKKSEDEGENQNREKLLIDATCGPADIKYQTDIGILNEAREKTEEIIDSLHKKREKKSQQKAKNL